VIVNFLEVSPTYSNMAETSFVKSIRISIVYRMTPGVGAETLQGNFISVMWFRERFFPAELVHLSSSRYNGEAAHAGISLFHLENVRNASTMGYNRQFLHYKLQEGRPQ
jgi:hypothetical protein